MVLFVFVVGGLPIRGRICMFLLKWRTRASAASAASAAAGASEWQTMRCAREETG